MKEDIILSTVSIPLVHLREVAERPEFKKGLDQTIRELDALIEKAARVRGYLDGRYGHGCGDQGHEDSVKLSNRLTAQVRKALGFTKNRLDTQF